MRKIVSLWMMLIATTCITLAVSPPAVLISRDSMRTKWVNGKKFLMHKVAKGETFYSISRDYKVDVKELMNANKGVTSLKTGQIIHVPVSENYVSNAKPAEEIVRTPEAVNEPADEKTSPAETKPVAAKSANTNVYHTVKKGETLSAISKKYNVPANEIAALNNLKKNQISINQKLLVKKESKEVTEETIEKRPVENDRHYGTATKYHTVAKGETLYGIAKKYQSSASDIIKWNDIKNNNIKTGQKLIVEKVMTPTTVTVPRDVADNSIKEASENSVVENKSNDVKPVSETKTESPKNETVEKPADNAPPTVNTSVIDKTPSGKNIKQSVETGEAAWVNDGELSPNKYFALHRTAPIGTIMKVTNRMNGKYVFVKVIGKLPGTGDNENLVIKISKAASERLGVLDQTFQCELNYAFASE